MELTGRDELAFLVNVGKSNAHAVDCHDGMHPTLSCLRSLGMMLFLSICLRKNEEVSGFDIPNPEHSVSIHD